MFFLVLRFLVFSFVFFVFVLGSCADNELWFDNKVGYIDCEKKERNGSICTC